MQSLCLQFKILSVLDARAVNLSTEQKLLLWADDLLALVDEAQVIQEYVRLSEPLDTIDIVLTENFKEKLLDND